MVVVTTMVLVLVLGVGVGVGDNGEHNGGHASIASEDSALAEYGPELAKRVLLGK